MNDRIEAFKAMYQKLDKSNLAELITWYSPEITFIDPFHQIEGIDQLTQYFSNLYNNVDSIQFQYLWDVVSEDNAVIGWRMRFRHPSIKGGKEISVEGVTRTTWRNGKVVLHRDYFDGAEMIYQNLPIIGGVIGFIKRRMNP